MVTFSSLFDDLSTQDVVFGLTVGAIVLLLFDFVYKYLKLAHLPGPPPLPLIGNLYMKDCVTKFQKYAVQLREKYGGCFVFWAAHTQFIVVTDAKVMRQVLTEHRTFNKGWVYSQKFAVGFGEGLVTIQSGNHHKADRALVQRYFVKNHLEKNISVIVHEGIETLREFFTPDADLELMDILHMFEMVTTHVFCNLECGASDPSWRFYPERQALCHAVAYGSEVIGNMIFLNLPTSKWFNPQVWKMLMHDRPKGHKLLDMFIEDRLRLREKGLPEPDDSLSVLLTPEISREKLYEHLTTLISAGFETTAHFGAYTSYLLAKHPDIQQKVKEEVRNVMGTSSNYTKEQLNQLEYLTCVMKESLRLYTIIPSVMRYTTQSVMVTQENGTKLRIPKNTNVMLPFSAINRVGQYWDKPNEFRPERFMNIRGESSTKQGYFPFAYGVRNCIGSTFALFEGKITLALLMQRVTFELNPKFKPKPTSGISLVSKNGMKLRVKYEKGYHAGNITEDL